MQCHPAFQQKSKSLMEVVDCADLLQHKVWDIDEKIQTVKRNLSATDIAWFWLNKSQKQKLKSQRKKLKSQLKSLKSKLKETQEIKQKIFNVDYLLNKKFSVGNIAALPGAIEESFSNKELKGRNRYILKKLKVKNKDQLLKMIEDVSHFMNIPSDCDDY